MGATSDTGEGSCDDVKDEGVSKEAVKAIYACAYEGCNSVFRRLDRLKRHICIHTGERPFKCDRPNCDRAYTHGCHLRRHIATSHQSECFKKILKCPYPGCHLTSSNESNLRRHHRRKHEKSFVCRECDKTFAKNHHLRAHQFSHSGESPYRCSECQVGFTSLNLLKRHSRCHKKYKCSVNNCVESFEKWSDLRKHVKVVHPLEFICDICQKKFNVKSSLMLHMRIHMKDRPMFPCTHSGCERSYSRKVYLKDHIKWFHDGIGFKCTVDGCNRMLSTKAKLAKHTAWHSKDHTVPKQKPKSRKKRADKGQPRRSMATLLSGLPSLPLDLEKKLITGLPLDAKEDLAIQELEETGTLSSVIVDPSGIGDDSTEEVNKDGSSRDEPWERETLLNLPNGSVD